VPDGEVDSENGSFVLDAKGAGQAIEIFESRGVDLVIDYGHSSMEEYTPPGGIAPAAGWIKELKHVAGDGLYGMVEWTEQAFAMLKADQYRYLSPSVWHEKGTRRMVRLDSVGLTHKPAIKGGLPVAASRSGPLNVKEHQVMPEDATDTGERTPDQKIGVIETLLKQKGVSVPEGASRDAILDAVVAFLEGGSSTEEDGEGGSEVAASARKELGLKEDAGADAVALAICSLKDKAAGQPEAVKLQARLQELEGREAGRRAEELIVSAVKENKLNPNNAKLMAHARKMAAERPEEFAEWMACQEPVIPPGRTTPPARAEAGSGREQELISNALKEHEGNYKGAMIALQTRLLDEECERTGMERKRAVATLTGQYPRIFG
jgi:hypothetical protein